MSVLDPRRTSRIAGLVALACISAPLTSAQAVAGIKATPVDFPAVTYACLAFSLPADTDAAKVAVEAARSAWVAAALSDGLARSTPLFVDAELVKPQGSSTPAATPARVCAMVPAGTKATVLTVADISARVGVGGFCQDLEVDTCLAQAATEAGYTDAKPWPRLPVFARWPAGAAAPTSVDEVATTLSSNMIDAAQAAIGAGATVEQNTGGLTPLTPCPAAGCPQPPSFEDVKPAGVGVGWFLPLAAKVPPAPSTEPPKMG